MRCRVCGFWSIERGGVPSDLCLRDADWGVVVERKMGLVVRLVVRSLFLIGSPFRCGGNSRGGGNRFSFFECRVLPDTLGTGNVGLAQRSSLSLFVDSILFAMEVRKQMMMASDGDRYDPFTMASVASRGK